MPPFCREASAGLGELQQSQSPTLASPSSSFQFYAFHSFVLFYNFFSLFMMEYAVNELSLMMVTVKETLGIPCDSLWLV